MTQVRPAFDTPRSAPPREEEVLGSSSDLEVPAKDFTNITELLRVRDKVKKRVQRTASTLEGKEPEMMMNSSKKYVVSPPQTNSTMAGKKEKQRRWLIRTSHPFRIKWDLCIIILAVWNCFVTPYGLVFDETLSESPAILTVDTLFDLIFISDIVLTFRTTYFSSVTGDEIFDSSSIAKNYLLGKFWVDLISCFPSSLFELAYPTSSTDNLSSSKILAIIGIMKLYRISRLNRIINNMRAKDNVKLAIRIGQLMFFLVMYIHLVACALWIVMRYDETWTPSNGDRAVYDREKQYQYWISFYAAVQLIFGGEIFPQTSLQGAFGGVMILCGTCITANLFGNMAVLMSKLNLKQTRFQESHNIVNTAMKNMRLPEELQQRISDYLIYTQATMASSEEFNTFNSLISPSLYNEVLQFLYGSLIKDSEIFAGSDEIKTFILPKLQPQFCKPEEMLISQGEEGERISLYFLARGSCQVLVKNEMQVEKAVAIIYPATHFGEVALITGGQRSASVRSLNYATLAVLQKEDFTQLISMFPFCVTIFKQTMFRYSDPYKRFLLRMLKRVPFFKELSMSTHQELLYSLKLVHVEEGDYIARPGQSPDQIYFLAEGQMEASITINDKDLNHRRIAMYRLKKDGSSRSTGWDLRNSLLGQSALKPATEMYPVLGPTGVEGAVHSTEKDSGQHKVLGRQCVELVLDVLGPGSPIGCFTAMSADQFTMQVKALGKCSCYVLQKSVLSRLRQFKNDLHQHLFRYETWAKAYTPLIDDYILANDAERGLEFKVNEHKSRYRLRGTVLRVVKENRDRRLTDTPLIALMLKTVKLDPRIRTQDVKNKSLRSFAQSLLQKTFDPKVRQQLLKHHDLSNVSTEVAGLAHRLVNQQENLQGDKYAALKASLDLLVHSIKAKSGDVKGSREAGTQTEAVRDGSGQELKAEEEVLYQTVPFRPH